MARNNVRQNRPPQRGRVQSNRRGGGLLRGLLEIALLTGGVATGWMLHRHLGVTQPATTDSAKVQQLDCPAPEVAVETPHQQVYSHAVTGEGVIEFKFYDNDNTTVTRKWIARIPIPAGAGLPVAPESPEPSVPVPTTVVAEPAPPPAPAPVPPVKIQKPAAQPAKQPAPKAETAKTAAPKETRPQAAAKSTQKRFAIQISAHRDRSSAEERVAQLEERGFDARVIRADIPGKGTWYRVRTGRNLTHEKATRLGKKLGEILGHTTSVVEQE